MASGDNFRRLAKNVRGSASSSPLLSSLMSESEFATACTPSLTIRRELEADARSVLDDKDEGTSVAAAVAVIVEGKFDVPEALGDGAAMDLVLSARGLAFGDCGDEDLEITTPEASRRLGESTRGER